jgi:hypothetical protein
MISPFTEEKKKSGTRVAVLFDYEGKRVPRAAMAPPQVVETTYPPLSATPDDERSAIKQAIVRWLNDK